MVSVDPTPDQRIGRVAAWVVAVAGIAATVVIGLLPQLGRLIAGFAWSSAQKEACLASAAPCAVSVVPFGPWLAWIALSWIALIAFAIVLCWSPRRWWISRGVERPRAPGVFSTPEWFRLHAFAALLITAMAFAATLARGSTFVLWEFAWPLGAAVAAIALATLAIRTTATRIDGATRAALEREYAFWLFRSERRRRARGVSREGSRAARRRSADGR